MGGEAFLKDGKKNMDALALKAVCTSVSGRYARALFEVANEHGALLETEASCILANDLLRRGTSHRLFILRMLRGSFPEAQTKLQEIAGFSDFFWRFLKVLSQHNRIDLLKNIVRLLSALVDEALGRISLTVFSEDSLTAPQRSRLVKQLQSMFHKQLSLTYVLEPRLLGGIKIQSNLLTLDASVRHQIERFIGRARAEFLKEENILCKMM